MATITQATLDQLLKNLYAPWEIEQMVNLTFPVLNEAAMKGSASLGGNGFFFPVRVESAEGHAYIGETQVFPPGGQSVVRQAEVDPKVFVGVVQLSGLSMAVSSQNAAAFARGFDENIQRFIRMKPAECKRHRYSLGRIQRSPAHRRRFVNPRKIRDMEYALVPPTSLDNVANQIGRVAN